MLMRSATLTDHRCIEPTRTCWDQGIFWSSLCATMASCRWRPLPAYLNTEQLTTLTKLSWLYAQSFLGRETAWANLDICESFVRHGDREWADIQLSRVHFYCTIHRLPPVSRSIYPLPTVKNPAIPFCGSARQDCNTIWMASPRFVFRGIIPLNHT